MYTVRSDSAAACLIFNPKNSTVCVNRVRSSRLSCVNNCESSQVYVSSSCLLVLTHQCEVRNLIKLRSGSGVDRVM